MGMRLCSPSFSMLHSDRYWGTRLRQYPIIYITEYLFQGVACQQEALSPPPGSQLSSKS